jgi:lipopolysaccharide heptosyltransferase II
MRIVVRGTNWIGDAVMTVPALRELRRIFPDSEIVLHTRSWAKSVFRDASFIDDILTFDSAESTLKEVLAQAGVLREHRFDLAILFPNSFASALTARFGGVPHRFGYSREGRRIFLTNPVKIPDWKNKRHEVYYYMNLVAEVEQHFLGTKTVLERDPDITLEVSPGRRANALKLLKESGADLTRKTVAIGAGSTNSRAKRWLPERFAELNDRLQRELGANVILLGSANEEKVANKVMDKSVFKPIRLTGKTTLDEAVSILAEVDLLISNDMGLAHIAPATGTDTIVIFGPTNPETTRPFSSRAEVIRKDVECSPCMLRDCPIDHRCMTWIATDEVFSAAAAKLAGNVIAKANTDSM